MAVDIKKYTLFLDKREFGILQPDLTYGSKNYSDYYVNVILLKNNNLIDYVQKYLDPTTNTIERQEINPYFMELDFFRTIKSISGDTILITTASTEYSASTIYGKSELFKIDINK